MSSFQQRLVEVMREHGVANAPQLAKLLGYSGSERVRLVLNGTSKHSFGMLEDIARQFALVDMRWLITGEGSMSMPTRELPGELDGSNPVVAKAIDDMGKNLDRIRLSLASPEGQRKLQEQKVASIKDEYEAFKAQVTERLARLERATQKGKTPPKGKTGS